MDRRRLLTAGMATLAASALPAHAHSDDHQDIVGSLARHRHRHQPAARPVQRPDLVPRRRRRDRVARATSSRHAARGTCSRRRGTARGSEWRGRAFEAFFRFLLQDADTGAPLGTDNVRLSLALVRNTGKLDWHLRVPDQGQRRQRPGDRDGTFSATPITV